MRIVDDLIFSPNEIVPEREEFSLSKMGLSVVGFQLSEAGTDAVKMRGVRGPVVVATNPKERVATISLAVREDAEASLATAAYRLQQKLGQIEEVGDWLKRVPYVGDFAGPVVTRVFREVSLGNMGEWQTGQSPDVTLQLLVGSEWLDAEEEEIEVETEQVGRATIVTVPPSRGTTRGLVRLRIKNVGEEHLRGLRQSMECRDAPADLDDPTAKPVYDCADLTPKGGAEVKTVSGVEVVEASLTAGWITILDSEIDGVGHMTHAGGRRPWLRVQNPESDEAQLRLRWRPLGATAWEENPIVPIPHHGGDYQQYDMGQALPMLAKLGDERWQFQVFARALSGSGKVRLHQVYPESTEQHLVVAQPYEAPAADLVSVKLPGTVEDKTGVGTIEWKEAAKAKASDNVYAKATLPALGNQSHYLLFKSFGFALPEGSTPLQALVSVERSATLDGVRDAELRLLKAGVAQAENPVEPNLWPVGDGTATYAFDLGAWSFGDVNSSGFGFVLAVASMAESAVTAQVDLGSIAIYYTEGEPEDRVCFALRSLDLRSESIERQQLTDDVWGPLSPLCTHMPYDPPGAVEGRPSRVLLVPSQGDFGEAADSGAADIEVEAFMRRPAFHLAQGATS